MQTIARMHSRHEVLFSGHRGEVSQSLPFGASSHIEDDTKNSNTLLVVIGLGIMANNLVTISGVLSSFNYYYIGL